MKRSFIIEASIESEKMIDRSYSTGEEIFLMGAEWGYRQAIEELRSESTYHGRHWKASEWADWLEDRLENKDECARFIE